MPRQPKSGETLVQIAPIDVTASIAMTASGMFGSVEATRSPGSTPRRLSWVARILTFPARSSQDSGVTGLALRVVVEGDLARRLARQDVLGVVEQRAGEPLRARHGCPVAEDGGRLLGGDDVVVVPDGLPERAGLGHRPLPELGVAGEVQAAGLLQPGQVRGDVRARDALLRRRPEQVARLHRAGHRIAGREVHGDGRSVGVRAHTAEVRTTGGAEAMASGPSSVRAILVDDPKPQVDGAASSGGMIDIRRDVRRVPCHASPILSLKDPDAEA